MKQEKEKIVLAYSGGLDTSVAIAWLKNKGYDVIACCIDVGEGKDLEAIKPKEVKSRLCIRRYRCQRRLCGKLCPARSAK